MGTAAMPIIDVMYEDVNGWHRFTSPQIPGLYVIVEPKDYEVAIDDLPSAIALLVADKGKQNIDVRRVPTFYGRIPEKKRPKYPPIMHYAIETRAA